MARPTAPGEEPGESEMDGNTGARIPTSTNTGKDMMKRRVRGFMVCSAAPVSGQVMNARTHFDDGAVMSG
jgi:hypothetical protein